MKSAFVLVAIFSVVLGEVYFKDEFTDDKFSNWVQSTSRSASERGKLKLTAGKFHGDAEKDKGMQTSEDARFYQISAKLDKFSNEGKSLVLQYTVKHEQNIDCGGGYIKLWPSDLDQEKMNGDSPYNIMFGPDICGPGTKKVHVIFTYKGKNHLIKKDIRCKDDELTHLYTLILNPDNTYEVRIDNEKAESGKLEEDWDMLEPKKIKDPEAKKPEDWVDEAKIDDPEDKKPEDWDSEPELIPDPEAKKPEDWDDEEDGEWEPAKINNPKYKGEWKAKQIDNPLYKGEWVHPEIDNPKYEADDQLYKYTDIGHVGFEIWQVKSGTIFDNIIVTDNIKEAEDHAKQTFSVTQPAEKKMKEKLDEEERKKQEEEDKKREAEEKKEKKDDKAEDSDPEDDDEDDEDKEPEVPEVDTKEETSEEKEDEVEEDKVEEDKVEEDSTQEEKRATDEL